MQTKLKRDSNFACYILTFEHAIVVNANTENEVGKLQ